MPELPDINLYLRALESRVLDQPIEAVHLKSPFFLRTFDPPISAIASGKVTALRRIGKRIAFSLESDLHLVLHLMVAGRLRWFEPGKRPPTSKIVLATLVFPTGTLAVTEASPKKRASLHLLSGTDALAELDPGGLEIADATLEAFAARLLTENHTLKRALTDPRLFSGIGNAYSDEILHTARLSPVALTQRLTEDEIERLFLSTQSVLKTWTNKLLDEFANRFPGPGDVTAFRPDFATHGKYGQPCRVCGTSIQRIRYAENETNYCPRCQTGGKLLADRSLSRLLKSDWPKTIDELENPKR